MIFSAPSTIILCLFLYTFYRITKNSVNKYFRGFYFLKTMIIFSLFDQNLSYLVYVCFSHLNMPFTFKFIDKISLLFTIFVLLCLLTFSLNIYFLTGKYLKKSTRHFHSRLHSCFPSYMFLTIKNSFRSFLRGAIYLFLHHQYTKEVAVLGIFEFLITLITLLFQNKAIIFKTKSLFCRYIFYHFFFSVLNFTFFL